MKRISNKQNRFPISWYPFSDKIGINPNDTQQAHHINRRASGPCRNYTIMPTIQETRQGTSLGRGFFQSGETSRAKTTN